MLLKGGTWGETTRESYSTHKKFNFNSGKLREGQKRRLNKPHLSRTLWESEAACRLYSTLGQSRNQKPPVLQDIGDLEQETQSLRH